MKLITGNRKASYASESFKGDFISFKQDVRALYRISNFSIQIALSGWAKIFLCTKFNIQLGLKLF